MLLANMRTKLATKTTPILVSITLVAKSPFHLVSFSFLLKIRSNLNAALVITHLALGVFAPAKNNGTT